MDVSTLVAPPYVAGPLRLEPFRALMLSSRRAGDPASARTLARPYQEVADRLGRWRDRGDVWHDPQPAVYLHEYTAGGITVRGLVGLIDVSRQATSPEHRAVLPHEGIYPAQADDLAERMAELRLNPAPILLVHRADPTLRAELAEVRRHAPDRRLVDRAEQQHRIWAIRDPERLASVNRALAPDQALIADGHHRYAAYLRLQHREREGPARYGLAMLVDHADTPLFLGAIHRVLAGTSLADLVSAAGSLGLQVSEPGEHDAIASLAPRSVVATDGSSWAVVDLPEDGRLPVETLHEELLPALPRGPRSIAYHHRAHRALRQARPGRDVAVLLPAADLERIVDVAAQGRQLPEKATSFQPKPSIGSVMRSLSDE